MSGSNLAAHTKYVSARQSKRSPKRPELRNLKSHPAPYVTIAELAAYWRVSRKQIYKQIDAGTLRAIRLGPRLLRVRTTDAYAFERRANLHGPVEEES